MRARAAVLALAIALLASASMSPTAGSAAGKRPAIHPLTGLRLPDRLMGLTVTPENVGRLLGTDTHPVWVDQLSLYSLRQPDRALEATLELARFKAGAPTSLEFERSIVDGLGGSVPIVVQTGGRRVYLTTAKGQDIAVWFGGGRLLILSILTSYLHPRDLLRAALEATR